MSGSKARKPLPAPEAPATATIESVADTSREDLAKKKKRKFALEDTLSVFNMDNPTQDGDLS